MFVRGGGCCDRERQASRPDGRLLAVRLTEDLALHKHEKISSYYISGKWMKIWGLAFQSRRHGKPQVGGMPSSHDSGEEWERKFCYVATIKA